VNSLKKNSCRWYFLAAPSWSIWSQGRHPKFLLNFVSWSSRRGRCLYSIYSSVSSSQLAPTVVGHVKLEKLECKGRRSSMKPSQKTFKASSKLQTVGPVSKKYGICVCVCVCVCVWIFFLWFGREIYEWIELGGANSGVACLWEIFQL
jgi:hypothetical protein